MPANWPEVYFSFDSSEVGAECDEDDEEHDEERGPGPAMLIPCVALLPLFPPPLPRLAVVVSLPLPLMPLPLSPTSRLLASSKSASRSAKDGSGAAGLDGGGVGSGCGASAGGALIGGVREGRASAGAAGARAGPDSPGRVFATAATTCRGVSVEEAGGAAAALRGGARIGAVGGPDLGSSGLGAYTGDAFEGKAGTRAAARASECVVGASGPGPARRDRPRRARTVVRMME